MTEVDNLKEDEIKKLSSQTQMFMDYVENNEKELNIYDNNDMISDGIGWAEWRRLVIFNIQLLTRHDQDVVRDINSLHSSMLSQIYMFKDDVREEIGYLIKTFSSYQIKFGIYCFFIGVLCSAFLIILCEMIKLFITKFF